MDLALGLIETRGLVGAIEAADAMMKAADVKLISKEYTSGALVIIKVMGETAAVKASVDAGSVAAQRIGELVSAHVIPRPDDQVDILLFDNEKSIPEKASSKKSTSVIQEKKVLKTEVQEKPIKKNIKSIDSDLKSEEKVVQKPKADIKAAPVSKTSKIKLPSMDQLVVLNVHGLRRIARGIESFPIKGRDISKANRSKLLDFFKELQ